MTIKARLKALEGRVRHEEDAPFFWSELLYDEGAWPGPHAPGVENRLRAFAYELLDESEDDRAAQVDRLIESFAEIRERMAEGYSDDGAIGRFRFARTCARLRPAIVAAMESGASIACAIPGIEPVADDSLRSLPDADAVLLAVEFSRRTGNPPSVAAAVWHSYRERWGFAPRYDGWIGGHPQKRSVA